MSSRLTKILLLLSLLGIFGCGRTEQAQHVSSGEKKKEVSVEVAEAPVVSEESTFKAFAVYTDKTSPDNHFIPSGWMGDHMDIKFEDTHQENPHSGATCIKVTYNNKASGGARWAGIYWQYPANNWGNSPLHYDLTGATKLTFWIRGDRGGEVIQEIKIGGIYGEYSDSDTAGIGPLKLTTEWKEYSIELKGKDLSHIIGGFVWSTNIDVNPEGAVFYLDDIKYE